MKRLILISGLALLLGFTSKAQQLPMFSQFMLNDYVLNPAIGGIHDYYQVKTTYRQQWMGYDGPTTYMISTYGPHATMDMGYGGYLFSDQVGPMQNIGVYGSYAYNFQIMNDIRLSFRIICRCS